MHARRRLRVSGEVSPARSTCLDERQGLEVVALESAGEFVRRHLARAELAAGAHGLDVVGHRNVVRIQGRLLDQCVNADVMRLFALQRQEAFAVQREVPARVEQRSQAQLGVGGQCVGVEQRPRLRAVAARELGCEHRVRRGGIVEQPAPQLVEQPLPFEGVFPAHAMASWVKNSRARGCRSRSPRSSRRRRLAASCCRFGAMCWRMKSGTPQRSAKKSSLRTCQTIR